MKLENILENVFYEADRGFSLVERWEKTSLLKKASNELDMARRLESLFVTIRHEPGYKNPTGIFRLVSQNLFHLQASLDKKWLNVVKENVYIGDEPRKLWMPAKNRVHLCSFETFEKMLDGPDSGPYALMRHIDVVKSYADHINQGWFDYFESRKAKPLPGTKLEEIYNIHCELKNEA